MHATAEEIMNYNTVDRVLILTLTLSTQAVKHIASIITSLSVIIGSFESREDL